MSNAAVAGRAPVAPEKGQYDRPPPFWVGDDLALDFLNSKAAPRGEPIEWLANGRDLVQWLVGSKAPSSAEAAEKVARFGSADLDQVAKEAVALREWFRGVLSRGKAKGVVTLSSQDLHRLNGVLARDSSHRQIENSAKDGLPRLVTRRAWRAPAELLVPVAVAMAELLCHADLDLLRKCHNPICTIWFFDRTKGHRRRWCTQTVCGNRAKVAAFRERERLKVGVGKPPVRKRSRPSS
jgi:predicted RNA-binding Zn ribbon-like protein